MVEGKLYMRDLLKEYNKIQLQKLKCKVILYYIKHFHHEIHIPGNKIGFMEEYRLEENSEYLNGLVYKHVLHYAYQLNPILVKKYDKILKLYEKHINEKLK